MLCTVACTISFWFLRATQTLCVLSVRFVLPGSLTLPIFLPSPDSSIASCTCIAVACNRSGCFPAPRLPRALDISIDRSTNVLRQGRGDWWCFSLSSVAHVALSTPTRSYVLSRSGTFFSLKMPSPSLTIPIERPASKRESTSCRPHWTDFPIPRASPKPQPMKSTGFTEWLPSEAY